VLLQQVETGQYAADDHMEQLRSIYRALGLHVIEVGVRAGDGQLVGFGNLVCRRDSGELGSFVVRPQNQGKGIGRAIIEERLRKAL